MEAIHLWHLHNVSCKKINPYTNAIHIKYLSPNSTQTKGDRIFWLRKAPSEFRKPSYHLKIALPESRKSLFAYKIAYSTPQKSISHLKITFPKPRKLLFAHKKAFHELRKFPYCLKDDFYDYQQRDNDFKWEKHVKIIDLYFCKQVKHPTWYDYKKIMLSLCAIIAEINQ